ncbi:MAG: YitT family protein [Pyrinomonadaceae bacterium]
MKNFLWEIVNFILIALGMLSAGLGIKGFLLPGGFIDGGVTGVSLLASALSGISLPVLILFLNLPFVLIGFFQVSRAFALRSMLAIGGFAACLAFFPYPIVTEDKLLAAIFGGVFVGAGIGLAIRGGAVLDGTEVLALLLSRSIGLTVGDLILALNITIFSIAAIFLGIETALYSMLAYFAASRTIDFLLHGIEEYNAIIIVSAAHRRIKEEIMQTLKRGVTVYKGGGGFRETEQDILLCVVTRLEIAKVKKLALEIDEAAFIVVHHLSDASGGKITTGAAH